MARPEARPEWALAIGTLYIDCLPVGETTVSLSTIIAEANAQICTTADDYRLEPDLGYGRAAGAMSSMVLSMLPFEADVACSTRLAEHRDCLSMLESLASRVVRGL